MGTIRLPADQILRYAEQYDADYDAPIANLVQEVKARGFLLKDDLVALGEWKSKRSRPLIAN